MTGMAWLTGAIICGVVWGGFIVLLIRAMRMEAKKPGKTGGGASG